MADTFEDFWNDIMCNSFVILGMYTAGLTLGRQTFVWLSASTGPHEWLMTNLSWWTERRGGENALSAIRGGLKMWWNSVLMFCQAVSHSPPDSSSLLLLQVSLPFSHMRIRVTSSVPPVVCLISKSVQIQLGQPFLIVDLILMSLWWWRP